MTVLQNTLYVTTPDAYLRLEGETVCVMVDTEKRLQVPLHHLGSLVCFGDVMCSPALLGRCMEDGRSVVWLNRNGRFQARVEGPVSGNILLRQAQYRTADDVVKTLSIAQAVVAGKLRNSRTVLLRGARDGHVEAEGNQLTQSGQQIANHVRNAGTAKDLDALRGEEGHAARVYLQSMQYLIREPLRKEFPCDGRNRRPPRISPALRSGRGLKPPCFKRRSCPNQNSQQR